jgi:uncharacterized protein (TIGR02594 family)
MDTNVTREVQSRLNSLGFGPLVVDGAFGKASMAAVKAFQHGAGLAEDGVVGSKTYAALFLKPQATVRLPSLPWIDGARAQIGLHEVRDNAFLKKFLSSDGATVGDPAKIAWCGDYVSTWLHLTLKSEPVWPANPFAAINWATWADHVAPEYGCVMSFHRGDPAKWEGHVAFYISEDSTHYHVLGANQNDSINIAKIPKTRLRENGSRWPKTGPRPTGNKIVGDGSKVLAVTSVT